MVGIHLRCRPRGIVREPCILRLNADVIGVAGGYALPATCASVVAPAGSDHIVGAVATEAKLSQWPREIATPIDEGVQAGHVAVPRPRRVVAYNAEDAANVAASAILPALNRGDLQTGGSQHIG